MYSQLLRLIFSHFIYYNNRKNIFKFIKLTGYVHSNIESVYSFATASRFTSNNFLFRECRNPM